MYAAIYRYAKEHGLIIVRNRTWRTPVAYLCIDEDGIYDHLDVVPKTERVKRLCPDIGKNRAASGSNANMICNKKEYIFCISDEEKKMTGNAVKHKGWMNITKEGAAYSSTMKSIWQFCQKIEEDREIYYRVDKDISEAGIKKNDFLSFRVNGIRAEECHDWEEWFDRRMSDLDDKNRNHAEKRISEITGDSIIPIQGKEKFPQIMTSQTRSGAPIYSCAHKTVSGNTCAFTSYGVVNSLGSPMSIDEAEAIKAGLEYLMTSANNHSNQFNIIYWYDDENAEDLIDLSINGFFEDDEEEQASINENAYKKLLNVINKGKIPEQINGQGDYHIIHFEVPAKGRFYLKSEKTGRYLDLYQNLLRWYEDSAITTDKQRYLTKLYGILFGLLDHKDVKDKHKEIQNEYGADKDRLLEAIYENTQIPEKYFDKAIKQIIRVYLQNSQSKKEQGDIRSDVNWPVPVQIVKVYLIRAGKENYRMDTLDNDNSSVAYNCGRLLATIDRLQKVSAGKTIINTTIGQKFFKSASRTPGKIMPIALANEQNYLKRIENEGIKMFFIHLLGDLSEKIGTTIPEKFSKTEQGEFMLGYFYQEKELRIRAKNEKESKNESGD